MIAQASVPPRFAKAVSLEPMNEDVLATAFLPAANFSLLPDPAPAVLAKTVTDWFALTLASEIHVDAEHGRICMADHIGNASSLRFLKKALLRLPGVDGLDMTVTVEALISPPRTYPAV